MFFLCRINLDAFLFKIFVSRSLRHAVAPTAFFFFLLKSGTLAVVEINVLYVWCGGLFVCVLLCRTRELLWFWPCVP